MKHIIVMILLCACITACAPKKPPLSPTQIVDGKSIVIPPEMDVLPEVENKE